MTQKIIIKLLVKYLWYNQTHNYLVNSLSTEICKYISVHKLLIRYNVLKHIFL